jgi:hypothetical protein
MNFGPYGPEPPDATYVTHAYPESLFDTGQVTLDYASTGSAGSPPLQQPEQRLRVPTRPLPRVPAVISSRLWGVSDVALGVSVSSPTCSLKSCPGSSLAGDGGAFEPVKVSLSIDSLDR